jgi:hypothetical protein
MEPSRSIFEYLYCDAANYKAWGQVLLEGRACIGDAGALRAKLDSGEFFIPAEVGLPSLQAQLWAACGCGPDKELDHCWHTFSQLREATSADIALLSCSGTLADLLKAFANVQAWEDGFASYTDDASLNLP